MISDVIIGVLATAGITTGGWAITKAVTLQTDVTQNKSDVLEANQKIDYILGRVDKIYEILIDRK